MESQQNPPYDRFDRYLAGELPEQEKQLLEEQIETQPALKQEFEDFIRIKKLSYAMGRLDEKASLHQISTAHHRQRQRRRIFWIAGGLLAAGIAIFLLVSSLRLSSASPTPDQLYASHFSLPDAPSTLGTQADSLLQQANLAFDTGDYPRALQTYQAIDPTSLSPLNRSQAALYQGLCHLMLDQPEAARERFAEARQHPEQSTWYRALSFLKPGEDLAEAKKAFRSIAEQPGNFYQEAARKILNQLEE